MLGEKGLEQAVIDDELVEEDVAADDVDTICHHEGLLKERKELGLVVGNGVNGSEDFEKELDLARDGDVFNALDYFDFLPELDALRTGEIVET